MPNLICERCGKSFYRDNSHLKKRYFCSPECVTQSRNAKYKPWTRYEHLTIIEIMEWVKNHWWRVLRCKCDCGKETQVPTWMWGSIKSCWCRVWKKHWMSKSKEYHSWNWMCKRCNDKNEPSYKWYGGRGIKLLYKSFEEFYEDVWPIPWPNYSIDRIDVNGDYWPWNCRWATRETQLNNTRRNAYYEMDWETLTVAKWSRRLWVSRTWAKKILEKKWKRI